MQYLLIPTRTTADAKTTLSGTVLTSLAISIVPLCHSLLANFLITNATVPLIQPGTKTCTAVCLSVSYSAILSQRTKEIEDIEKTMRLLLLSRMEGTTIKNPMKITERTLAMRTGIEIAAAATPRKHTMTRKKMMAPVHAKRVSTGTGPASNAKLTVRGSLIQQDSGSVKLSASVFHETIGVWSLVTAFPTALQCPTGSIAGLTELVSPTAPTSATPMDQSTNNIVVGMPVLARGDLHGTT